MRWVSTAAKCGDTQRTYDWLTGAEGYRRAVIGGDLVHWILFVGSNQLAAPLPVLGGGRKSVAWVSATVFPPAFRSPLMLRPGGKQWYGNQRLWTEPLCEMQTRCAKARHISLLA